MVKHLSEKLVALNINGLKKSYMNTNKNRVYLMENLPDIWNEIKEVWGDKPYYNDKPQPLKGAAKEDIQQKIIDKMKNRCIETITNGINFNGEHYSFEITDQLNLSRLAIQAKEGKEQLVYHADGQACRFYTTQEILNLYQAMENFIEYQTTYFNSLKNYIKTLEYKSQIEAVYYGMQVQNLVLTSLVKEGE